MKNPRKTAFLITLVIVLWVLSGLLFGGDDAATKNADSVAYEHPHVRIESSVAALRTKEITVYGVTRENRRVDLKAETTGVVTERVAKKGSYLQKGDLILKIETRNRDARVEEAKALVKQREIEFNSASQLSTRGFQAENKLAEAASALEAARAQLINAEIDLHNTNVFAPFDGTLETINVQVGDLVGPNIRTGQGADSDGSTLATVVDRDPFIVIGQLSERVIHDVKEGLPGRAELVTGEVFEGKVRYVESIADPVTRTFAVELEIANPNDLIASGVTAKIYIPVKEQKLHHIASSVLSLDKNGQVGVKVLDEIEGEEESDAKRKGIAHFYPVKIMDTDNDGLWVSGLPDQVELITVGHAYVKEGTAAIGNKGSKVVDVNGHSDMAEENDVMNERAEAPVAEKEGGYDAY